jgi:hypothetical protein
MFRIGETHMSNQGELNFHQTDEKVLNIDGVDLIRSCSILTDAQEYFSNPTLIHPAGNFELLELGAVHFLQMGMYYMYQHQKILIMFINWI